MCYSLVVSVLRVVSLWGEELAPTCAGCVGCGGLGAPDGHVNSRTERTERSSVGDLNNKVHQFICVSAPLIEKSSLHTVFTTFQVSMWNLKRFR